MQRLALTLLIGTMAVLCCAANRLALGTSVAPEVPPPLRNSHVSWKGTRLGLLPALCGTTEAFAENLKDPKHPDLIRALDDKHGFVAAHVILTQMVWADWDSSFGTWNGLPVELFADGRVEYGADCQPAIRRKWLLILGR